ncbi:hypothetical protein CC86DRAFT_147784 [Ophiobolus disseminans]|uniref:Uncharacterized protein n=1 Tax=Ophiobolus disseminans TaxID=1469910 RepID=A0A6A6ZEA0_9PLEO|nr:hypothetical protein CC86DRAFT_147784 [Ophiobolus disseminans]
MPLCTIHLLALHPTTPISTFLSTLKSSLTKPLVTSRVIRWIILPTHISTAHLLARNISWDVFLVWPDTSPLPQNLEKLVQHHWSITAGVPSRLLVDFETKNRKLLYPEAGSVPRLGDEGDGNVKKEFANSSQNLELSAELDAWIHAGGENGGAVSMFNLLSFVPGKKEEYLKYGAAFAESIGSRHGGNAKIVGNVVNTKPSNTSASSPISSPAKHESAVVDASADGWHEVALAHYPSIWHFREMLRSEDYQDVNHKYRVGSLADTAILMTSEMGLGEEEGVRRGGAKL